jgi:hypothetical protein
VEVEMAWPEAHAVAGLNRRETCQHAIPETESLDRTRVHRIVGRRVVAARNRDDLPVVRRGEDLVRVFAGVGRGRLIDALTQRAILVDTMDGQAARIVEGGEQIFAGFIDAGVDRPGGQRQRRAVRGQLTGRGVDPECIRHMLVARHARAAIARHHVEIRFRWMRPGILDVGRRRYRTALDEGCVIYIDAVDGELRSDTRIEYIFDHGALGE